MSELDLSEADSVFRNEAFDWSLLDISMAEEVQT